MVFIFLWLWAASGETSFQKPDIKGYTPADPLNEVSGLVASRSQPGVLWTHNDSGGVARFFAISADDAQVIATYTMPGASARDYEDIAIGPGPEKGVDYLFIGDFGNNDAHRGKPREHIIVYRLPEPKIDLSSKKKAFKVKPDALVMRYPDGAHDVEAMIIDPKTGDLYLLTKRDELSRIYRTPKPAKGDQEIKLEYEGEMTVTQIVASDISPDGSEILVKLYPKVLYYKRQSNESIVQALTREGKTVPVYLLEQQGEAIAWDAEGSGFFTLSEARKSKKTPLFYYSR